MCRLRLPFRKGIRWRAEKSAELAAPPVGTVAVFNVDIGQYVTATSRIDAMKNFHQTFGAGTILAYSFEVGRLVFIVGGIASRRGKRKAA